MELTGPPGIDQRVDTNSYPIDLPVPMEELLTVAIDDTANTVVHTGITGIFCHNASFLLSLYYNQEIVKVTLQNLNGYHIDPCKELFRW